MSSKNKDLDKAESNKQIEKAGSNAPENKDTRRSLLKKLAVGGIAGAAIPTKWSKPVIDAVVLPAHAQTSNETVVGGGGGGGSGPGPAPANSIGEEVLDFFTSPAHAGGTVRDYCIEIEVKQSNGTPTAVTAYKVCFNLCCNPRDGKFYDQTMNAVSLTGSGSNWTGQIPTKTGGNKTLTLTNLDPNSATLAQAQLEGIAGTIINGGACNCPCETGLGGSDVCPDD